MTAYDVAATFRVDITPGTVTPVTVSNVTVKSVTPVATPTPTPVPTPAPTPTPVPTPTPTTGRLGNRIKLGAFVYNGYEGGGGTGDPWDPAPHFALEKKLGRVLSPVSVFLGWDSDFPATQFAAYGTRDLLISWDPNTVTAAQILAGTANAYIDRFAAAVDKYTGGAVYIRPMAEMNGDWARWCPSYTGSNTMGVTSPAVYIQVWRYIVSRVATRTSKVRWVFCPNIVDSPNKAGNRLEEFWPGATYVHVIGVDGYNWGNSGGGNFTWTSFDALFGSPQGDATKSIYDRLTALDPTAPIWICEFGCKDPTREDGKNQFSAATVVAGMSPPDPTHNKATWYTDMLDSTKFPRLTTVVAFHIVKERDWRMDSPTATTAAIIAGLKPT